MIRLAQVRAVLGFKLYVAWPDWTFKSHAHIDYPTWLT